MSRLDVATRNRHWGCVKLVEECGELLALIGKRMMFRSSEIHPDQLRPNETPKAFRQRFEEEIGDVCAALAFLGLTPPLNNSEQEEYSYRRLRHETTFIDRTAKLAQEAGLACASFEGLTHNAELRFVRRQAELFYLELDHVIDCNAYGSPRFDVILRRRDAKLEKFREFSA